MTHSEQNEIAEKAFFLLQTPSCRKCKHAHESLSPNKRIYLWCHNTNKITSDTAVLMELDKRGWCEYYEKS